MLVRVICSPLWVEISLRAGEFAKGPSAELLRELRYGFQIYGMLLHEQKGRKSLFEIGLVMEG